MGTLYTSYGSVFTRPADTTTYAANDVVGINIAVTAATNATPIVVTTAASDLVTGDVVTITGSVGNTAANGTFRITKLSSTTFSLTGSVGNGAWSSGGAVAKWHRFQAAGRVGGQGLVRGWRMTTSGVFTTNGTFSLALFKGPSTSGGLPPAATLDNVAMGIDYYVNRLTFIHKLPAITITAVTLGTTSSFAEITNIAVPYDLDGTNQELWGQLIAESAYVPASAQTFGLSLDLEKF